MVKSSKFGFGSYNRNTMLFNINNLVAKKTASKLKYFEYATWIKGLGEECFGDWIKDSEVLEVI